MTVLNIQVSFLASTLGGRPGTGLAFSPFHPPRRYAASHLYIVTRLIRSALAIASGLSPACTLATARVRITSSVA